MRWARAPSSVSSSRPSLSWSRRPAGYTPGGSPNSASVRRGGTLRSVNWHSTPNGLLSAISATPRRACRTARRGGAEGRPLLAGRLHEAQGHAVALADGAVLLRVGVVVARGRQQGPHAVGVVPGVGGVGVDLAGRIEPE